MQIPLSNQGGEWRRDAVNERDDIKNVQKMPQSFDVSQIFSIMMGITDCSAPPELPQVEFSVLQNWVQVAVVFSRREATAPTATICTGVVESYSAFIAYNGIVSEEKRRALYQFLTEYFLEYDGVSSLVIQQPQQMSKG